MEQTKKGQIIGYKRVSTIDQNEARQLDGIELDCVFVDKASGKDTDRPKLKELLTYARSGDVIKVHSLDRMARNLDDLRSTVDFLIHRGIDIHFIKENLVFKNGYNSAMSNLLLSVMGAFAEFERSLINERQREGIELAKKKNVYKGRRKVLSDEQIVKIKALIAKGKSKVSIAKMFNISTRSIYRYAI